MRSCRCSGGKTSKSEEFLRLGGSTITTSIKRITENIKYLNLASGFPWQRSSSVHLPIIFSVPVVSRSVCSVLFSITSSPFFFSVKCETNAEAPVFHSFRLHLFQTTLKLAGKVKMIIIAAADEARVWRVEREWKSLSTSIRTDVLHCGFQ